MLLIEDEKNIAELVSYNLSELGYSVVTETAGNTGLERARKILPDLILLDLMLPGLDGLSVCRSLKQSERTAAIPVILLTAKSEEVDKIVGFEIGADDYIVKPFSPRELCARVKAVLRRGQEVKMAPKWRAGALEMNDLRHEVLLRGKPLPLTSKEYDLLKALLEARGRVLTREVLLEKVWGYDQSIQIETRTVDMHVGQLRKKIKQESERIITIKNVGYRFEPDE